MIAFDIGGTWFRSAVVSETDEILHEAATPAVSWRRFPEASLVELQRQLIEYFAAEADRLGTLTCIRDIGISLGAAMDARSGRIVAASPLWGATGLLDFDLLGLLRKRRGDFNWFIVNDVTAAALGAATIAAYAVLKRFSIVTVSSGLALRTIEPATGRVPTSVHSGLQGEIGHLPASLSLRGKPWSRRCDCGVIDHLSSFSSGRGIEALLMRLASQGCSWLLPEQPLAPQFRQAVEAGDLEAIEVLNAVTEPLARTILAVLTIDAEVDQVLLTGGVVDALRDAYVRSLLENMQKHGLYGSSATTVDALAEIVRRLPADFFPTLRGAAYWARRCSTLV